MALSAGDRLDLLELVLRADAAASRRDADGYAALFTTDADLEGEEGTHGGREALRRSLGSIWATEGPSSVHLTLNAVIAPDSGTPNEVRVDSLLVILSLSPSPAIFGVFRIEQTAIRAEGAWRIRRRAVHALEPGPPPRASGD